MLRICAYNIWMLPQSVKNLAACVGIQLSPDNCQRALQLGTSLPVDDLDVLILCEAFDSNATNVLIDALSEKFPFHTECIRPSCNKITTSGVCVISRFPITHTIEKTFEWSLTARDDALANKGVVYCQLELPNNNSVVHLFATHLQAWNQPNCEKARIGQLALIKEFIDGMNISKDSCVIVAGDLNIDRWSRAEAYAQMLEILDADDPFQPDSSSASKFSFDADSNILALGGPSSGGENELLDYVLISRQHRGIKRAESKILRLKTAQHYSTWRDMPLSDLSDQCVHFRYL